MPETDATPPAAPSQEAAGDGLDDAPPAAPESAAPASAAAETAPPPTEDMAKPGRSIVTSPYFTFAAKPGAGQSTEDWLITYADMVTLLLTTFVLLVLTASFDKVTEQAPGTGLRGVLDAISQLRVDSPYEESLTVEPGATEGEQVAVIPQGTSLSIVKDEDLDLIERREAALDATRKRLAEMKLDQFISARDERGGIRLEIPNSILFDTGSAELQGRGRSVLQALVPLLAAGSFTVSVEGHTDNTPIATPQFPSNWELSAFRAAQVVRLLIDGGIAPERLEAVGHADTRPLAGNATESGRSENRRVTILLRL